MSDLKQTICIRLKILFLVLFLFIFNLTRAQETGLRNEVFQFVVNEMKVDTIIGRMIREINQPSFELSTTVIPVQLSGFDPFLENDLHLNEKELERELTEIDEYNSFEPYDLIEEVNCQCNSDFQVFISPRATLGIVMVDVVSCARYRTDCYGDMKENNTVFRFLLFLNDRGMVRKFYSEIINFD